jgi:hypothetical protein
LKAALDYYLANPMADQDVRTAFLSRECTYLDGLAGKRTAQILLSLLEVGRD